MHDAFDQRKISPSEVIELYLKEIQKSNLNAYITVCETRARQQAQIADSLFLKHGKVPREAYPLFGVPTGIKDVLTIDGVKTTCASKMLENYIPPYTATAVDRLEKAGAITLGKLNMDEFAMGSSNENSAFGPVQHPTHPGYVPGGSSGGSATAVKAGLCLASLGTDTGGSIRLPASFCGLVGAKPTYGRISRYGLIAFASSLDQVGPFTQTVEDCARLLDVLCGPDPKDSTTAPVHKGSWLKSILESKTDLKGLKIGIPEEYFGPGVSSEVSQAIQQSQKWFESQGAKIFSISLPHTRHAVATYYIVAVSEASSNLSRMDGIRFGTRPVSSAESKDLDSFYKKNRTGFGAEVKRRILLGTYALSSGYYDAYYKKACQVRRLIRQDFDEAFKNVDLILSPVAPTTAFKSGEKTSDPLQMYLMDVCTIPASLAGLPAMTLPCGIDSKKLPIGLQLIAPHFKEDRMLSAAHQFEKGFGHVS